MFLKRFWLLLFSVVFLLCLNLEGCSVIREPVVQKECLKILCVIIDNVYSGVRDKTVL